MRELSNTSSDIIIGPPFYFPRLVFEADGTYRIRAIAAFGSRILGPTSFSVTITGGETESVDCGATPPEVTVTAVGAGTGAQPTVIVYDDSGKTLALFFAFERSFRGGVHVALGDIDGDGQPDLIAAAGASGGPHVRVFSGLALLTGTAKIIREFFAYDASFFGGVKVAASDVNGDGYAEIVTGAGPGGGPHAGVFDGHFGKMVSEFYAYAPDFRGGVNVAAGETTGDRKAEVVTGPGIGGGPHVPHLRGPHGPRAQQFLRLRRERPQRRQYRHR